jgi:Replication initiator protein, pSAM2
MVAFQLLSFPSLGSHQPPAGPKAGGRGGSAGVLWHRTTTLVARHLARQLDLPEKEFRQACRVSFGKVAEFQARGLVQFRVIIRLDGADGPQQPAPGRSRRPDPSGTIRSRRPPSGRYVPGPARDRRPAAGGRRKVRWGVQLDIQQIAAAGTKAN